MKYLILLFLLKTVSLFGQDSISRIAFGSCGHQDKPLTIFQTVVNHQPDLFIFLGDNIYGDTDKMCALKRKYRKLSHNENFKKLKETTPIIATWDDHDYGFDDSGRYYSKKEKSKEIFLNFFKEPRNSKRREHNGIYTSYYYKVNGKTLQIILLDNRTFRDNLLAYNGSLKNDTNYRYTLDYSPIESADSTFLGDEQWKWLKDELLKPADVRIIGSSTQFATQYNGYETWSNMPYEQKKMLELIKSTNAKGVFFISGDVHYSELSKLEYPDLYPIYDLTSSGLTEEWKFATFNKYRIGKPVMENHFGIIDINWNSQNPTISLEIWDFKDTQRISQLIKLEELK